MGTDKAGTVVGTASGLEASGLETSGLEARGLRLVVCGLVVWRLVHCRQPVIPWANKWYQSRTSAGVILTDGEDRRF